MKTAGLHLSLKIPPHYLQRLQHRLSRDLMILQQHNQIDSQLTSSGHFPATCGSFLT